MTILKIDVSHFWIVNTHGEDGLYSVTQQGKFNGKVSIGTHKLPLRLVGKRIKVILEVVE